jgi:hypothetical protein
VLPEHLAAAAAPVRHPEVFAALSAAAADLDLASLASEVSSRGSSSRTTAGQLQQRLQQHILGAAGSGLLYAQAQQKGGKQPPGGADGGGSGGRAAGAAAVLKQVAAEGAGPVDAAGMLLQRDAPAADVRQSYVTLLGHLSRQGPAGSSAPAAQQQQQQQVCLARVNWAGYEASRGCWGLACRHLLDAGAEVQQCPEVLPLLQGCFLGLLTSANAAAAAAAGTPAPAADSRDSRVLLEVLLAAVRTPPQQQQQVGVGSSNSNRKGVVLAPLQLPSLVYEDAGVRQHMSSPCLQAPHALLGPPLDRLLQPLARREVSKPGGFSCCCARVSLISTLLQGRCFKQASQQASQATACCL